MTAERRRGAASMLRRKRSAAGAKTGDLGRYSTKAASKMPPTKSYSVGLLV